jgi:hypothetical protein
LVRKRFHLFGQAGIGINGQAQTVAKMTLAPTRLRLFGEPQLLEGEDPAAYDELLARFRAAVKPVDIIEEMFIADVVALEWEV